MSLTIGVDVGGTNTDAIILKQSEVICVAKTPTTEDVTSGLEKAIRKTINDLPSGYNINQVQRVNIGTTHFVNALVQRKGIVPVAVLRLCGPASRSVPPFTDFPDDLRRVIAGPYFFLNGGYEYDGHTIISEVDDEEVKSVAKEIVKAGIRNVVIIGVFSSVNADQEEQVKKVIRQTNPDLSITVSHDVGQIGFLERENASILNESLKPLCVRTVGAFESALQRIGLPCPFYLTQNDGTIVSASRATELPVFTFSSGPTNSMRGAAHLSNLHDAIVVDIGGTTADVGVLCNGFPRQSSTRVKVGGVNTNFRMPDVLSIGLGGGSLVLQDETTGKVTVGPQSVGYKLDREALVFGGNVMTATDIAVAGFLCNIGDREKVSHISEDLKTTALSTIKKMVEDAIDQVKISSQDQPVLLVGGGSILIDCNLQLKGASTFIKPAYFQAANAVGAALGKVSGVVDKVYALKEKTEAEVMNEAVAEAYQEAEKNGAKPESIETIDKMAVKLAYLPGNVTRIQVKTVGDLADHADKENAKVNNIILRETQTTKASHPPHSGNADKPSDKSQQVIGNNKTSVPSIPQQVHEHDSQTEPHIDQSTGEWVLNEFDVECMAIGAGILGCGGGGSPYIGKISIQQLIRSGKKIRVIHPDSLLETDPVVAVAFMGAPVISIEKLPSGFETSEASKVLGPFLKKKSDLEKPFAAVVCAEVGGMNSMEPLAVAAELGIPVVDADGMGRAFPELQMFSPFVYGCQPFPAGIADEKGNALAMAKVTSSKALENYFRIVCVHMGCSAGIALKFSGKDVHQTFVKFTLSRIWRLGRAVLQARKDKLQPVEAILKHEGGKLLFTGKISAVERQSGHGFDKGTITVESSTQEKGNPLKVEFQNENCLAYFVNNDGTKNVQACVPDLISLVDSETGQPIPTEEVRYGLRVAVLAMCCSEKWTTPRALSVVGPSAFGYGGIDYVPVGKYVEHSPLPKVRPNGP